MLANRSGAHREGGVGAASLARRCSYFFTSLSNFLPLITAPFIFTVQNCSQSRAPIVKLAELYLAEI